MALRAPIGVLVLVLLLACSAPARANSAALDRDARAALAALYETSPAARALGARAKAILVFPSVRKATLLIGGEGGEGVLFQNGRVGGHYAVGGVEIGFEAGAQSFAYALFLMSDRAVAALHAVDGFAIGADPNIVVASAGAAADVSSTTVHPDVYSFVFRQTGLMAGVSLQGTKISRLGN